MSRQALKTVNILGVNVCVVNLRQACLFVEECIKHKKKTYVCVAPVSTIVDCQKDPEYNKIINGAGMVTPDGIPVVWLGKLKGEKGMERTYGPDLMLSLCQLSEKEGHRHFFYGGRPETNSLLARKLQGLFPKMKIAGSFAPSLMAKGQLEQGDVLRRIDDARPDVLWVGLGSPKQDYWMHRHRDHLDVPVMVGVGAAFDFIAGTKPQAPPWMRNSGLEWLFRLCCEPRRLWKRYLIGNTQFIYYCLRDMLFKKDLGA